MCLPLRPRPAGHAIAEPPRSSPQQDSILSGNDTPIHHIETGHVVTFADDYANFTFPNSTTRELPTVCGRIRDSRAAARVAQRLIIISGAVSIGSRRRSRNRSGSAARVGRGDSAVLQSMGEDPHAASISARLQAGTAESARHGRLLSGHVQRPALAPGNSDLFSARDTYSGFPFDERNKTQIQRESFSTSWKCSFD